MAMGSCGSGALLTSLPHPLSLSLVWVPSLWGVPSFRTGDFLQFSLLDQSSQTVRPLTVRYRLYCALAARLSGRGPVAMVPYFPLLPPPPPGSQQSSSVVVSPLQDSNFSSLFKPLVLCWGI